MARHSGWVVLKEVLLADSAPDTSYPFGLAAVRSLPLRFDGQVAVLVGDNGSAKSTLIEAIAVAAGFNPEGGSGQVRFETEASHSDLAEHLELVWSERLSPGWFLRAETFYNVATFRDQSTGPKMPSYHEVSHGESFLQVARDWFQDRKLFVLDEPEAALSFHGQLALVAAMLDATDAGAQFILATHSPVLMATPGAEVFQVTDTGLVATPYEDLEIVELWRSFLDSPERFLRYLSD